MQDDRGRGVSLWLMPGEPAGPRLAALIATMAARLGTPTFPPHLTLLPEIERPEGGALLSAASTLAAGLRPLTVRLASVEGRDEHFRCLIAVAAADEPLRAAHAAAARAFGREPDPGFLPHVSLVYGSLPPGTKRALIQEAARVAGISFEARHLHVWRTDGAVGDWREIGFFALGGETGP